MGQREQYKAAVITDQSMVHDMFMTLDMDM